MGTIPFLDLVSLRTTGKGESGESPNAEKYLSAIITGQVGVKVMAMTTLAP